MGASELYKRHQPLGDRAAAAELLRTSPIPTTSLIMPTFTYQFDTKAYKKSVSFETGLFINGKFQDGSDKTTIDVTNPSTGKLITAISEGTRADVDLAVAAAQKAYETSWGLK
ncbi:aldehyde dehydrogenase (NAD(P)(+)) ald5, partial [Serendipita sp. 399]